MNLSSWMILVFLLSAGTSLAAVNVNWLTGVVDVILRTVKEHGLSDRRQFSLAANIPENQDPNTLQGVLNIDNTFKKRLKSGAVYQSSSLVTAQTVGADHAEHLVLGALQPLMANSAGHVLIIYSLKSPCSKCTAGNNDYSILPLIRERVIPRWGERAVFVFTTVYDRYGTGVEIPRENVIQSLENLGDLAIGLANVFRCYPLGSPDFQCHSCSVGTRVSEVCVDNNFVPGQGGRASQNRERSRSPIGGGGFIGPQRPGGSSSSGGFIGPQRPGGSPTWGGFIGPQIPGGSSSQSRERSRSPIRGGFIGPQRPGGSSSQSRERSRSPTWGGFIGPQRPRYGSPGGRRSS